MRYYLSKNETEFVEFARGFKNQIDSIAAELNLDADEVEEMVAAFEEYEKDLKAQAKAKIDYKTSVTKKDSSKKNVKSKIQKLAKKIKSNKSATDVHLRKLNLPVSDEVLSRSKMPDGSPFLTVEIKQHRLHKIEIRNAENMVRAKPSTAVGAEIWVFVGERNDLTEKNMRYLGTATRSKFEAEHDLEDAGKTAHYMARWINRRGIRGAWSATKSATIAE